MLKPKKVAKDRKDKVTVHPLIQAAEFLAANMSDDKKVYWSGQARKKGVNLSQIVLIYLGADFGVMLKQNSETETYVQKKEKDETSAT